MQRGWRRGAHARSHCHTMPWSTAARPEPSPRPALPPPSHTTNAPHRRRPLLLGVRDYRTAVGGFSPAGDQHLLRDPGGWVGVGEGGGPGMAPRTLHCPNTELHTRCCCLCMLPTVLHLHLLMQTPLLSMLAACSARGARGWGVGGRQRGRERGAAARLARARRGRHAAGTKWLLRRTMRHHGPSRT